MFRSLIIGLLIVASLGAAMARAQDPGVFLPFYFIYDDRVVHEGGTTADNHQVVYYESHPAVSETALITREAFIMNIMRARYFSKFTVEPGRSYSVGVALGGDGFGMNPFPYNVTGKGFDKVELTLRSGEGGGLVPPAGTVPLLISKDGGSVKLSWDLATYGPNIQLFLLTGDGTGKFTNTYDTTIPTKPNWGYVTAGGAGLSGEFDWSTRSSGYVYHANQERATGWPESYYKALRQEIPPTSYASLLPTAWAVGKINIPLQGTTLNPGKNLVSVPFVPNSRSVKDVFGEGTLSPWGRGDLIQYKYMASPAYLTAIYTADSRWKDAANTANEPTFDVDPKFGNWIITTANKTVMVLGNVPLGGEEVAIFSGAGLATGGKTLLGQVYPVPVGLAGTSLISDGAANGDLIQYKRSPLEQVYVSAIMSGGDWKNAIDGSPTLDPKIAYLTIPNSYIYVRNAATGFTWRRARPY